MSITTPRPPGSPPGWLIPRVAVWRVCRLGSSPVLRAESSWRLHELVLQPADVRVLWSELDVVTGSLHLLDAFDDVLHRSLSVIRCLHGRLNPVHPSKRSLDLRDRVAAQDMDGECPTIRLRGPGNRGADSDSSASGQRRRRRCDAGCEPAGASRGVTARDSCAIPHTERWRAVGRCAPVATGQASARVAPSAGHDAAARRCTRRRRTGAGVRPAASRAPRSARERRGLER